MRTQCPSDICLHLHDIQKRLKWKYTFLQWRILRKAKQNQPTNQSKLRFQELGDLLVLHKEGRTKKQTVTQSAVGEGLINIVNPKLRGLTRTKQKCKLMEEEMRLNTRRQK